LSKSKANPLVLTEKIEPRILTIRGQRIILDADLADLYGVTTKRLNQQVKRNAERFPQDFMFQLSEEDDQTMRSQFATASRRNIRYLPYAFKLKSSDHSELGTKKAKTK
jgi:hypothetical protein